MDNHSRYILSSALTRSQDLSSYLAVLYASGLEPLSCSLRVCGQWLLSVARVCELRIDNGSLVRLIAHYCRVLRSG
jgi:hypothetical protein